MSFHMAHLSYGNYIAGMNSVDNMAPFRFQGSTAIDFSIGSVRGGHDFERERLLKKN